ncbi:MAG: MFS transporter [Stellaceae bacterium]
MPEDRVSHRNETAGGATAALAGPMPLFVLGLSCFASNISVRAVAPMLPVIAGGFTVTLHTAAWLATAYGVSYALAQPILGPLADAFGKSVVIKFCLALLAVSLAGCALAPSFPALLVVRGISGAVAGGVVPAAFALVGDRVAMRQRQLAISRLVIAVITGQMAGAVLSGGLAEWVGWRGVFIAAGILVAFVAAGSFFRLSGRDEPRRHFSIAAAADNYRFLLTDRHARLVYGTVLCEGMFMFGVFPFIAPMLLARGEGGTLIAGFCIAGYAMGGLIYGLSARAVIGRLGPWRMMATGGIVVGICYGIATQRVPWPALAALFVAAGFGFYLLHNTMQTFSTELAPQARGAAVALFASFYFIGQGLGPVMSGQISAHFGYAAMFAASAVLTAVLGVTAMRLIRRS